MEILLLATLGLLVITTWTSLRQRRQIRIIRHIFAQSMDWSAEKIDQLVAVATDHVVALPADDPQGRSTILTRNGDRPIPIELRQAKAEWSRTTEKIQSALARQGIRHLDARDRNEVVPFPGVWIAK